MTATGELPNSSALSEANPQSLDELLSRDPEGYSKQDRMLVIKALREQRARYEAAEAAGKAPRASKAPAQPTVNNPADLGL